MNEVQDDTSNFDPSDRDGVSVSKHDSASDRREICLEER